MNLGFGPNKSKVQEIIITIHNKVCDNHLNISDRLSKCIDDGSSCSAYENQIRKISENRSAQYFEIEL